MDNLNGKTSKEPIVEAPKTSSQTDNNQNENTEEVSPESQTIEVQLIRANVDNDFEFWNYVVVIIVLIIITLILRRIWIIIVRFNNFSVDSQ